MVEEALRPGDLRFLEDGSGLEMLEGTLYLILNRLKAAGLLHSEWLEAGSGHPRKYYRLTPAGEEWLRAMAQFWREFSAKLDDLIAPVPRRREVKHVR